MYGFENEHFTEDIANYKDTIHYLPSINTLFLQSIAKKQHLLTKDNIDMYLDECESQAYAFDISQLAADAQELIDASTSNIK
ncbi:hypothetical protein [Desulfovibrio sp.]|uniref:hypothetical protein n=1 Tax=Desulfovibrio sp. TaxID=885 RepID=UPI0035AF7B88